MGKLHECLLNADTSFVLYRLLCFSLRLTNCSLYFSQFSGAMKHNDGGMVSCRLRANSLSNYTELQAGGNASN
jgi:hypothetical protein